jgi:hypothetical protein
MLLGAIAGRGRFPAAALSILAFAIPGWWLVKLAVVKRPVLRVKTPNGVRKLLFEPGASQEELQYFVTRAASQFHYRITPN